MQFDIDSGNLGDGEFLKDEVHRVGIRINSTSSNGQNLQASITSIAIR